MEVDGEAKAAYESTISNGQWCCKFLYDSLLIQTSGNADIRYWTKGWFGGRGYVYQFYKHYRLLSPSTVWTATELENLYGKETGLRVNLQWADVGGYLNR